MLLKIIPRKTGSKTQEGIKGEFGIDTEPEPETGGEYQ